MKLPLSWLGDLVAVEAEVSELARRLTIAGLEVEGIEHFAPSFSGVVVAKVLKVERHPNADRLSLCEVDAGVAGRFTVVCGAPNVAAGMTGALAMVGARLGGDKNSRASEGGLDSVEPLQTATIRGVRSEGMLCSERELGLADEHSGILVLPDDAPPGADVADYLRLNDSVLDIAITPNRGDCLSILGLAREVAALFDGKLKLPKFRRLPPSAHDGATTFAVEIEAADLCPHYAALPIEGVTIGPSPIWIKRRLELCGMRSRNNVVDVTNYVMLELGQPLHAFDAAHIAGGRIIVRRAGAIGEMVTLDGVSRALVPADLLIADAEKALAIAGVMGGLTAEVGDTTKAILLESAYFEPSTIARTSRRLGLRSEASYRFERGIDRAGQVNALLRAAELIRAAGGGGKTGQIIEAEPRPAERRQIIVDIRAMNALLGTEISPPEAAARLRKLGIAVRPAGKGRIAAEPPSFRPDLNEPADLAEEVGRLSGFGEVPSALPARPQPPTGKDQRSFYRATLEVMLGCGMWEVRTIPFVAPADNENFGGIIKDAAAANVANPLSAELSQMRLSLLPGLIGALQFNLNRQASSMHCFEMGKVFAMPSASGTPVEGERLGGLSYGDFFIPVIGQAPMRADFFTVKGVLESYFQALNLSANIEFRRADRAFLHPGRSAVIEVDGQMAGYLGELHPREAMRLQLTEACVVFELDSGLLMTYGSTPPKAIGAPPKFPAVRRDLALVVDRDLPAETALRTVSAFELPLLEGVELFDVYEGSAVAAGKKSIALACRYRARDRTLTDDEVNRAHAALTERAVATLGAELRR